jgi:DNA-binding response OmpR family regulator
MPEKILIVDDDVDTLRMVGLMLQRQGYQIVAANNGNQALIMAQNEQPDLILLDIMMPDMDGYEVTRRLREDPNISGVPIIMFTAKSKVEDRVTGFEVGADDFLTKPTLPQELFVHIKNALEKNKAASPIAPIHRGQVIGIMAAKGGLGISTLAVNLGISLHSKTRQEVIVAEFRPGEGSIGLDLGLQVNEGLVQLFQLDPASLTGDEVERVLVNHASGIKLLLSSYHPRDTQYRSLADEMSVIAQQLSDIANFVLLDLGPGMNPATEKVLDRCDQVILALEPSPHSVARTKLLIEDLAAKGFGANRLHIVLINRLRLDIQLSWNQVKDELKAPIAVAFTPVPELAYQAAKKNLPIVSQQPDSLVAQQFAKLADTLTNQVLQRA